MEKDFLLGKDAPILVTGSNGFIGSRVVEHLLAYGFSDIRCFVRHSSSLHRLEDVISRRSASTRVRLVKGDLLSKEDCASATRSVQLIIHLAAGFDKSFAGAFMNSALATRNLLEAFLSFGQPRRFVNVSSFAVYSSLKMERGEILDEDSPLEDNYQARQDAYGFGKFKQEELVRRYGRDKNLPYVILRPGTVFGPGKKDLTGRIGIDTFGFFAHVGGRNQLPLTFVDNCAEAVILAGIVPGVDGRVFNVVDDELLTSAQFLKAYRRRVGRFFSVRIPYPVAWTFCVLWERYSRWSKGQLPAAFNRRRCVAEWGGSRFTNRRLRESLGWTPRVGIEDAMNAFLSQFPDD